MPENSQYDAVIIGSGPNGLSAAISFLRAGKTAIVYEAKDTPGGGMRTEELTLPGFKHDVCSAIHPLGVGSPFFGKLPLKDHGLEWIYPPISLAHPFDDGTAAIIKNSITASVKALGNDAQAYYSLMQSMTYRWHLIVNDILGPFKFPRHPFAIIAFGLMAIQSAKGFAERRFKNFRSQALFGGLAAHAFVPLDRPATAAFGIVLGALGHIIGWPMPKGGTQSLTDALKSYMVSLGGKLVLNNSISSLDELPPSKAVLMDITPRQILKIAGTRLPEDYKKKLETYRYGPGVFKVDFATEGPIPFKALDCRKAGVVHLGGTFDEIFESESDIWSGKIPKRPLTLVAQQSLFDPSRTPDGKHTVWAYCHVPHGSVTDMTEAIENQIERFAPGFKNLILSKHTMSPAEFEAYNSNYIGGDINGGVQDLKQLFSRPVSMFNPYNTPVKGLYICSSSTPPGGGVHGMCGYHAAVKALKDLFGFKLKI